MLQKSGIYWGVYMKQANEIEHKENFDLLPYNTLRVSSVADDVYFPSTKDEFVLLLSNLDNPVIIGKGSNLLLSSYGIKRPVIITKHLNKVDIEPPLIEAEAGVLVSKLAEMALELKLHGFEFFSALPASLGGAVCMNAGANTQAVSDYFISAEVYDSIEDKVKTFSKEDMNFTYRNSALKNQDRYILLSAKFELLYGDDYTSIESLMRDNVEKRKEFQPSLKDPNIGCVFKNPVNENNYSAGQLLDMCNLKSCPIGGAMVYFRHANFIINFNNATSLDYLKLMKEMQNRVLEKFKIKLQPEVVYIGDNKNEVEIWKSLTTK